ncbi:MFS transporter [Stenotrophomonas maltophilia]
MIKKIQNADTIRTATPLLLGLFLVGIPSGLLSSVTSLRLDQYGYSATAVGLVSSAYFVGLALGAMLNDRFISKIGHIRAYAAFASLLTVSVLAQGLTIGPWPWTVSRLINGLASAGIFLVIESWLLLSAPTRVRGQVLAFYMIALYGSGVIGQLALGAISTYEPAAAFIVSGMLISLSMLPIVALPKSHPSVNRLEALPPWQAYRVAPAAVTGCFVSGLAIAAVYALLPLYLQKTGYATSDVGTLMACTIVGAMLTQYPIGRWSDQRDRRSVLIVLSIAMACASVCVAVLAGNYALTAALLFLLGGAIFTVYPVSISLAADRAAGSNLVPMIQGLLLINSAGSAISPLAIASIMSRMGPKSLFYCFAVLAAGLACFIAWRRRVRQAPKDNSSFTSAPPLSPAGSELVAPADVEEK